jgi:hypothetical protein
MQHTIQNYSRRDPECRDGDAFVSCNLSQAEPETPICVGRVGLTFRDCNLLNCRVPDDAVVERCNTAQVRITVSEPDPAVDRRSLAERCRGHLPEKLLAEIESSAGPEFREAVKAEPVTTRTHLGKGVKGKIVNPRVKRNG